MLEHLVMDPESVIDRANENAHPHLSKSDYPGSPKPYHESWLKIRGEGVEATATPLLDEVRARPGDALVHPVHGRVDQQRAGAAASIS